MEARYYITDEEYEIAKANGISRSLLNSRVRLMEWPKEKAITEPVQKRGKKYPAEIIEKARENGVPYYALCQRIRHGWSVVDAINTPVLTHKQCGERAGELRRRYPKEYAELAAQNGISYSAFTQRVLKGMTYEEAATIPQMTPSEIGKRMVSVREEKRKRGELNARKISY